MVVMKNRFRTYQMSKEAFAAIAFSEEINWKRDKKGRKIPRTDEEQTRQLNHFVSKLTSGTIGSRMANVVKYLNEVGSFITPINRIVIEGITA